ncbi:MAG TPA: hypothetical protein VEY96_11520, partial [Actinomycetes bacterium]|nr:hypothetical protein [Actinomycetes bacterium]
PFVRTALRRPPHTAASWMLGAGIVWLGFAVVADLAALAGSPQVVDLDRRIGRLVPAVVAGFALQTLTGGALTTCCRSSLAVAPTATASSAGSWSWPGRCG